MPPPTLLPKNEKQMTPPEVQNKSLMEWFDRLKFPRVKLEHLLIGGAVLAVIGLALSQSQVTPPSNELNPNQFCQEIVQPQAIVTREQLAKLLTIPERDKRVKVQAIVKQPYCKMPSLNIRAGATTEREAYPLDSDPQTWLVVAYEGDSYVGYGFKRD
jgi:hypothetical protein